MRKKHKILLITGLTLIILIYNIFFYNEPNGFTIMLDPGHGGVKSADKGAHKEGIDESDLNDEVTSILAKKLKRKGYKVLYSRKPYREEEEVSLSKRTERANEKEPDLFLSIHHDSGKEDNRGYTVYYSSYKHNLDSDDLYMTYGSEKYPFIREELNDDGNSSFYYEKDGQIKDSKGLSGFIIKDESPCKEAKQSKKVALSVGKSMSELDYIFEFKDKNNSVLVNDFRVLRDTNAPSILIECGFMSNHEELENLKNKKNQNKLAQKILEGVNKYFNVRN